MQENNWGIMDPLLLNDKTRLQQKSNSNSVLKAGQH